MVNISTQLYPPPNILKLKAVYNCHVYVHKMYVKLSFASIQLAGRSTVWIKNCQNAIAEHTSLYQ